jgi:hypothetical protein
MSALADFRALVEAPGGPQAPEDLALALADAARAHCEEAGLIGAEIDAWGPVVTMILSKASAWEALAAGPDEFQFYPGYVKADGAIQWANVWTADFLSLARLVDEVAARINEAARGKAA